MQDGGLRFSRTLRRTLQSASGGVGLSSVRVQVLKLVRPVSERVKGWKKQEVQTRGPTAHVDLA